MNATTLFACRQAAASLGVASQLGRFGGFGGFGRLN